MKKILALIISVILIISLPLTASALLSPEGEKVHKVYFVDYNSKVTVYTVEDGKTITFESNETKGNFTKWVIYQLDGKKTPAVLDTHYSLGYDQTLNSEEITITSKNDLIVVAVYNNKEPNFTFNQNGEVVAPKTNDISVVVLSAMLVITLAGVVLTVKKQHN